MPKLHLLHHRRPPRAEHPSYRIEQAKIVKAKATTEYTPRQGNMCLCLNDTINKDLLEGTPELRILFHFLHFAIQRSPADFK